MPLGAPLQHHLRRRRRRRFGAWLGVILLLSFAGWADRRAWFGMVEGTGAEFFGRRWVLVDIVSGPILEVAPLGSPGLTRRVRLVGLATACGTGPDGEAEDRAREAVREVIGRSPLRIEVVGSPNPDSGVPAVRLWDGDAVSLNERLLAEGWCCAEPTTDHRRQARYRLLEEQARRDGIGRWRGRVSAAEASP